MGFYIACTAVTGLAEFYCVSFNKKKVEALQDRKGFNKVLVSHRRKSARASRHWGLTPLAQAARGAALAGNSTRYCSPGQLNLGLQTAANT